MSCRARLGYRACPGRRTHPSRRVRTGPWAHSSRQTRPGLRPRLDCRTCPGVQARQDIRPRPDFRARSTRQARPGRWVYLDRRACSGRRTRLEHWANDLNGLDRAILTNLTAQSCSMGCQAYRSSGHPACLGFLVGPTQVGRQV